MIDERYRAFLVDRLGTNAIPHSRRTLFAHLQGTCDLLEKWGNSLTVCTAGLFHSVYGTRRFRVTAFPMEGRDVVRQLIGVESEHLAYLFCVIDRPRVLIEQPRSPAIMLLDYHEGRKIRISPRDFDRLLEIEAANLLEQHAARPSILNSICMGRISKPAKLAILSALDATDDPRDLASGVPLSRSERWGDRRTNG